MSSAEPSKSSIWSYLNLSLTYERKARLVPALICMMTLVPISAALGGPILDWIKLLLSGVGLAAVGAVGLSHLASIQGNVLQNKLWPRWPRDSPTNLGLLPADRGHSSQQKQILYGAIQRLTGLDIQATAAPELEATINDAVARLRNLLYESPLAKRLDMYNADYGLARNFSGLRPFWLSFSTLSAAGCWFQYLRHGGPIHWSLISTGLAIGLWFLSFGALDNYVRARAGYYAESFFSAVLDLDKASTSVTPSGTPHPAPAAPVQPVQP